MSVQPSEHSVTHLPQARCGCQMFEKEDRIGHGQSRWRCDIRQNRQVSTRVVRLSVRRSTGCQPCCHRKADTPFFLTRQKPRRLILSTYNALITRIFTPFLSRTPTIVYTVTANHGPGTFRPYHELKLAVEWYQAVMGCRRRWEKLQ